MSAQRAINQAAREEGGPCSTAVSSEAWAKLRDWASVAGRGRLLLSGSFAHASLKTAVEAHKCGENILTYAGWDDRLKTFQDVI